MAKPYRRRKGKAFVGSFRVTLPGGQDVNLQTKDANEATRRAKLAVQGKWPPIEAAAAAAAAALDPATEDHEAAGPVDPPAVLGDGGPQTGGTPDHHLPPSPAVITPPSAPVLAAPPAEALAADAAAAAAEVTGEEGERVEAAQIEAESAVNAKLSSIMAKLTGEAGGADALGGLCGMAADLLLAAEKKTIEWGGTWALQRRGKKAQLVAGDPPELMREALSAGLHGYAVVHFPDFASKLTPGWAVTIGLVGSAGAMMAGCSIVKLGDDGKPVVAPPEAPAEPAA